MVTSQLMWEAHMVIQSCLRCIVYGCQSIYLQMPENIPLFNEKDIIVV
jgi:hypothetical protein